MRVGLLSDFFILKKNMSIIRLLFFLTIVFYFALIPVYRMILPDFQMWLPVEYIIAVFAGVLLVYSYFLNDNEKCYLLFSILGHALAFLITAYHIYSCVLNDFSPISLLTAYAVILIFTILIMHRFVLYAYSVISYSVLIYLFIQFPQDKPFREFIFELFVIMSVNFIILLIRNAQQKHIIESEKELCEMNRSLKRFSYSIVHDLKEPLRTFDTSLLIMSKDSQLTNDQMELVELAQEQSQKMNNFISKMLDFAESRERKCELDLFSSHSAIEESKQYIAALIEESSAKFIIANQLPDIYYDKTLFSLLLQNLFQNAIKYHKPDTPPLIKIHAETKPDNHIFHITDNGIGIKAENRAEIFKDFNRCSGNRQLQGAGIGLATCKRIVERLGGEIWVESTLGEGSSFSFSIPKADQL